MGKGRPKGRPFACAPRVGEGKGNLEASTGVSMATAMNSQIPDIKKKNNLNESDILLIVLSLFMR